MRKEIITAQKAPAALGPYSHGVLAGGVLYVSGQLGLDPDSGEFVGDVAAQAEQALKNMGEILAAAGMDYGNVVKTTVLLADIGDFAIVNEVYGKFFAADCPARSAFQVAALPKAAAVEIEAIAVK